MRRACRAVFGNSGEVTSETVVSAALDMNVLRPVVNKSLKARRYVCGVLYEPLAAQVANPKLRIGGRDVEKHTFCPTFPGVAPASRAASYREPLESSSAADPSREAVEQLHFAQLEAAVRMVDIEGQMDSPRQAAQEWWAAVGELDEGKLVRIPFLGECKRFAVLEEALGVGFAQAYDYDRLTQQVVRQVRPRGILTRHCTLAWL